MTVAGRGDCAEEERMSILAWLNLVIGIVGAVIGGWIVTALGGAGITGFNLWSLLVAIVGAIVLLVVVHAVRRA
jgi:uncharacterized membrane protein YeaQ/YmgE (transglycosylase-associated protein family)